MFCIPLSLPVIAFKCKFFQNVKARKWGMLHRIDNHLNELFGLFLLSWDVLCCCKSLAFTVLFWIMNVQKHRIPVEDIRLLFEGQSNKNAPWHLAFSPWTLNIASSHYICLALLGPSLSLSDRSAISLFLEYKVVSTPQYCFLLLSIFLA